MCPDPHWAAKSIFQNSHLSLGKDVAALMICNQVFLLLCSETPPSMPLHRPGLYFSSLSLGCKTAIVHAENGTMCFCSSAAEPNIYLIKIAGRAGWRYQKCIKNHISTGGMYTYTNICGGELSEKSFESSNNGSGLLYFPGAHSKFFPMSQTPLCVLFLPSN